MESLEFTRNFLKRSAEIANQMENQSPKIAAAIEILFDAWRSHAPVFIIGNGGSASTATHFAADLVKTVAENPGDPGLRAMALADNIPLVSALTNDWKWDRVYDSQLATFWQSGGIVIAISVNGGVGQDKAGVYSQNLVRALQFAKDRGGLSIGLVGDKHQGGAFKDICDVCIMVPDGSTPQVESFHVLINHLITFALKAKIKEYYEGLNACS